MTKTFIDVVMLLVMVYKTPQYSDYKPKCTVYTIIKNTILPKRMKWGGGATFCKSNNAIVVTVITIIRTDKQLLCIK